MAEKEITLQKIDIRGVIARVLLFFIILTLLNIIIFIIIALENQSELLRDNAIYKINMQGQEIRYKILAKFGEYENVTRSDTHIQELKEYIIEVLEEQAVGTNLPGNNISDQPEDRVDSISFVVFEDRQHRVLVNYNDNRQNPVAKPMEKVKIQEALTAYSIQNRPFVNDDPDANYNINLYIPIVLEDDTFIIKWKTTLTAYQEGFANFVWQSIFAGIFIILVHTGFIIVAYNIVVKPLRAANVQLETQNTTLEEFNAEIKEDLRMAQKLQEAIIPKTKPDVSHINVGSVFISLEAVSGDYLDIIEIDDDHLGLLIVDVSGHGVPSALVTTMAKVSFNSHSTPEVSTAEICEKVNLDLCKAIGDSDYYCTAFYIIFNLNTFEIEYTSCGHPQAVLMRTTTNELIELQTKGFYIGAADFATYFSDKTTLQKGDKIILYTDGIVEAENSEGEIYDFDRLFQFVRDNQNLQGQEFSDLLVEDVYKFRGNAPRTDDISVICLDILNDPPGDHKEQESIAVEETEEIEEAEETEPQLESQTNNDKENEESFNDNQGNTISEDIPANPNPNPTNSTDAPVLYQSENEEEGFELVKEDSDNSSPTEDHTVILDKEESHSSEEVITNPVIPEDLEEGIQLMKEDLIIEIPEDENLSYVDMLENARVYIREGLLDLAIEQFKDILDQYPDKLEVYLYLGKAYLIINQWDAAKTIFNQLLDKEKNSEAYNGMGIVLYHQKQYDEAHKYFELALEMDETNPSFKKNRDIVGKILS